MDGREKVAKTLGSLHIKRYGNTYELGGQVIDKKEITYIFDWLKTQFIRKSHDKH